MNIEVQELSIVGDTLISVTIDKSKTITFKNVAGSICLELMYDSFDVFEKYPIIRLMIGRYKDNTSISEIKRDFQTLADSYRN